MTGLTHPETTHLKTLAPPLRFPPVIPQYHAPRPPQFLPEHHCPRRAFSTNPGHPSPPLNCLCTRAWSTSSGEPPSVNRLAAATPDARLRQLLSITDVAATPAKPLG